MPVDSKHQVCTEVRGKKGCDQVVYAIQQTDGQQNVYEVQRYHQARYVGSSEATWRTLGLPIHDCYPPVVQLAVHLKDENVYNLMRSLHYTD